MKRIYCFWTLHIVYDLISSTITICSRIWRKQSSTYKYYIINSINTLYIHFKIHYKIHYKYNINSQVITKLQTDIIIRTIASYVAESKAIELNTYKLQLNWLLNTHIHNTEPKINITSCYHSHMGKPSLNKTNYKSTCLDINYIILKKTICSSHLHSPLLHKLSVEQHHYQN